MDNVKVGVIGVGHLGMHHARVYTEILGAQLVGVVDVNEDRVHAIAEPLGVPAYTDLEYFLEQARPDALSIVVPTVQHFDVAKTAMTRGINVLIEKPVTTSVDEAERLLKLAVKKNLFRNGLFVLFFVLQLVANMGDANWETHVGLAFFVFFFSLFLWHTDMTKAKDMQKSPRG